MFCASNVKCNGTAPFTPRPSGPSPVATIEARGLNVALDISTSNDPSRELNRSTRFKSVVSTLSCVVGTAIRQLLIVTGCFELNVSSRTSVPFSIRQTTTLSRPTSCSSPDFLPTTAHRFQRTRRLRPSAPGSMSSAPSVATTTRLSMSSRYGVATGYICSTGAANPGNP